jgi:hypothetical protein
VLPRFEQDPIAQVEEREVLLQALGRLMPRQRAAVVLTELLEMTSRFDSSRGHFSVWRSPARRLRSVIGPPQPTGESEGSGGVGPADHGHH